MDKDDKPQPANKLGPLAPTDQKSIGTKAILEALRARKKKAKK